MCLPSVPSDYTFDTSSGDWEEAYPPSEYCPGSFVEEGRFSAGDHSALGVSPKEFVKGHGVTMLRQPEQRIMSAYWDRYHSWPKWYYKRWPVDALEYAKVLTGCAVRMMVRDEASKNGEYDAPSACGSIEPATGAEVALAKQRLREDFPFVGITEEWDLSMCLLHAVFGGDCLATDFQDSNPNPRVNASASTFGYDTSDLQGYKDLADGALYTEAQAIFQEQMQRYDISHETCQPCFQQAASR